MKEVKVKWHKKDAKLSQMYSSGVEYAFVSKDYEMIHQLVYCKDYLQDAIAALLTGEVSDIYGFVYDPEKCIPIYLKRTRLVVTNRTDQYFSEKIPHMQDFLNQVESKLKMLKTQVAKVSDPYKTYKKAGVFLLNGSPRWMISPPMISLYTLLIRVGLSHVKGKDFMQTIDDITTYSVPVAQDDDIYQMKKAKKALGWILEKTDKKLFYKNQVNNYKGVDTSTMHDYSGIGSYADGYPKSNFPRWYKGVLS